MKKGQGPTRFEDLKPFSCLEVSVRNPDDFENAVKRFKSLVQKSQILSLYKEKQVYEKPSDKKRRKRREAEERKRIALLREQQIASGEWDRKQKKKEQRRKEKMLKKKAMIEANKENHE